MAYTKHPKSILRVQTYLDDMLEKKTNLEFKTDNPPRLAYLLRQALHCVPLFDGFQHYFELVNTYSFTTQDDAVWAKYIPSYNAHVGRQGKATILPERKNEDIREISFTEFRAQELGITFVDKVFDRRTLTGGREASAPEKLTIDMAITSPHAIIGAAIKYGETNQEIYFPYATMDEGQLTRLSAWTHTTSTDSLPAWQLIDHEGAGLTLTRKEVAKELVWTPSPDPSSSS